MASVDLELKKKKMSSRLKCREQIFFLGVERWSSCCSFSHGRRKKSRGIKWEKENVIRAEFKNKNLFFSSCCCFFFFFHLFQRLRSTAARRLRSSDIIIFLWSAFVIGDQLMQQQQQRQHIQRNIQTVDSFFFYFSLVNK